MCIDNTLRIKITNKCNRNCSFCHQEGDMENTEPVTPTYELYKAISKLCNDFNIDTIALTGGEPLLYPDIINFTANMNIKKFTLTTNGTIKKDYNFWNALYKNGLSKVNISISDIMDEKNKFSILKNQIETIRYLNSLKIKVNINIVIFNDLMYTLFVIRTLQEIKEREKDLNFDIVILPNLNDYDYSIKIIEKMIKNLSLISQNIKVRKGTSNYIKKYVFPNGNPIYIKSTKLEGKPILLEQMCNNCRIKHNCQEGFYGLRLEIRNGIIFIRLCIHKNTKDVLIPYEKFINSSLYTTLMKNWN